jgi:integrase
VKAVRTESKGKAAMARTLKQGNELDALTVQKHVDNPTNIRALNDGGGLYLRKSGSKWCWYFRATSPVTKKRMWVSLCDGKPFSLARGSNSTLALARIEAESQRVATRSGNDVQVTRLKRIEEQREEIAAAIEAKRRAVTFRQVFDQWRATDLPPRKRADGKRVGRKDGGQFVAEQFERHVFPVIGEVAIENITSTDVWAILDAQKAAGKLRTANVLLADLKQLFTFALDRNILTLNPTARIDKEKVGGSDVARMRHLKDEEIIQLAKQLPDAKLSRRSEIAVWLILATGARVGELMGAAWSNHQRSAKELLVEAEQSDVKYGTVNLLTRQWFLPDTKNQRSHTIHLSEFALDKFRELAALQEHGDWIFPDTSGTKPVCVKSFGKQIADRQRVNRKAMKNRTSATSSLELPGGKWTAHDLRRTAGTLMGNLGTSTDVINECLNHKQADKMATVYIHTRREAEQAIAFDELGAKLRALTTGEQRSNVVNLPTRKRTA